MLNDLKQSLIAIGHWANIRTTKFYSTMLDEGLWSRIQN